MKPTRPSPAAAEAAKEGVILRSEDGRLFYWLRATTAGLWVQRDRRRANSGARLVQSHVFRTGSAFARWCDADTVRFDYPIVFTSLQREGQALLDRHGHAPDPATDNPAG